jgi:uncharacterized protein (UPF0332 family)
MEPDGFWRLANRLMSERWSDGGDARYRAVIHAAYYAVYHEVMRRLGIHLQPLAVRRHAEVKKRLLDYRGSDAALNTAKKAINTLLRDRERADYRLTDEITADQARHAVLLARKVMVAAGRVQG